MPERMGGVIPFPRPVLIEVKPAKPRDPLTALIDQHVEMVECLYGLIHTLVASHRALAEDNQRLAERVARLERGGPA